MKLIYKIFTFTTKIQNWLTLLSFEPPQNPGIFIIQDKCINLNHNEKKWCCLVIQLSYFKTSQMKNKNKESYIKFKIFTIKKIKTIFFVLINIRINFQQYWKIILYILFSISLWIHWYPLFLISHKNEILLNVHWETKLIVNL